MFQTDTEILELCQNWNQDAFWLLYDKYIDQIYKFVYLKLWDVSIAEDLTSEIFFKVFNKINTYHIGGAASFKTWIYKVAYNAIIDFFRTRKEDTDLEEIVEFVWYENDFWKEIDDKDAVKKVLTFLESQPEKARQICMMRFWDDLSFKEIATITWESVDNCKKIVSRTLQKMPTDILALFLILFVHLL